MEQLTEAEIQEFVEKLDAPEPSPRRFVVELVTAPWVTFAQEAVMAIAANLGNIDEVLAPVAMLDMETGDLCVCLILDDVDAAAAVQRATNIFHVSAADAGVSIPSFERVFCYPAPDNYRPPDEEEYVSA